MGSLLRHDVWPVLLLTLVMAFLAVRALRDRTTTMAFRGLRWALMGALFAVGIGLRIVDAVLKGDGLLLTLGCIDLLLLAVLAVLISAGTGTRSAAK